MVHPHPKEMLDQHCQPNGSPSLGGKTKLCRAGRKPTQHLCILVGGEFARSTGAEVGDESLLAACAEAFDPASDRPQTDSRKFGCFCGGVSVQNARHRQMSRVLPSRPWRVHDEQRNKKCENRVTRLI